MFFQGQKTSKIHFFNRNGAGQNI